MGGNLIKGSTKERIDPMVGEVRKSSMMVPSSLVDAPKAGELVINGILKSEENLGRFQGKKSKLFMAS